MAGYRGKKHGFTEQMAGHTGIRVSQEETDCYSQNQRVLLIKWQVVQISGFPLKRNTITRVDSLPVENRKLRNSYVSNIQ